jgi:WD40 repeat protein
MSSLVLATAGYDHAIRFWEATSGVCSRTIPHADSQVNRLEISQDKKLLAAAGNPSIRVYDIASAATTPQATFDGHAGNVSAVGFQKDRRWLFSGVKAEQSDTAAMHTPHSSATLTWLPAHRTIAEAGVRRCLFTTAQT